jgi:hypothetical protein
VYYWDGGSWGAVEQRFAGQGPAYGAIWADARGSAFVANGVVEHLPDGCSANLWGVSVIWGVSSTDVWASTYGYGGSRFHFDGHTWSQVLLTSANSIAGNAWNDVWVATGGSGLLHWDGTAWCQTQGPAGVLQLSAAQGRVWGIDGDNIWSF